MSGSFHPNSDADRLYFCRRDGGRGIRAIRTMYESRIISIRQHLRNIKDKSEIHEYVYESEANNIVRVGYELLQRSEMEDNIKEKPRTVSKTFSTKEQNLKRKKYSSNLQIIYPHYKFQTVPIVIGALGYVPKCLEMCIHQLGFNKIETEKIV